MLECRAFTIRSQRNPATAFRYRFEDITHARERFCPFQIFVIVSFLLGVKYPLALFCPYIGSDELKSLIAIQSGITLQYFIRYRYASIRQCFLQAQHGSSRPHAVTGGTWFRKPRAANE